MSNGFVRDGWDAGFSFCRGFLRKIVSRSVWDRMAIRLWVLWAVVALVSFLTWTCLAVEVLDECYRPVEAETEQTELQRDGVATKAEPRDRWWEHTVAASAARWRTVVKSLCEDRSGASVVCIAIFLLALAKFGYLRWRLMLHRQLLKDPEAGDRTKTILGGKDPVVRFLATRGKDADLQLLERRLAFNYDLHGLVGPCITLGLFGTLIGLWMGFVQTLAPAAALAGGASDLQMALNSSVVVVATAALSSITGIGLGRLVIEPLAVHVDRTVEVLVTELMEKSFSSRR